MIHHLPTLFFIIGMIGLIGCLVLYRRAGLPEPPEAPGIDQFKLAECVAAGIPYEDHEFWPPLYLGLGLSLLSPSIQPILSGDRYLMTGLYASHVGDVVPLFEDVEGRRFYYRVKGVGRAGGDDHIVSPMQFWVEFDHSATPGVVGP